MYNPISCEFYDQLEVAIQRKIPSTVVYIQEEQKITVKGVVKTLLLEEGKEFMLINKSVKIRLDWVFSFNGKKYKEE